MSLIEIVRSMFSYDTSLKFGNPPPPFTSNKKMYIPAATCTQIEVLLQNLLGKLNLGNLLNYSYTP